MRVRSSYVAGTVVGVVSVAWGMLVTPVSADPVRSCQGQVATIVGTDGDDTLTGTDAADVVWLGDGIDTFHGGDGNDLVCGGAGPDSLYGEAGDDRLYGSGGSDFNVIGGPGDDVVHGGPGDDPNLHGDDYHQDGGSDHVYGDSGDDTLHGEPGLGSDVYDGGPGTDRITFYLSGGPVTLEVAEGTASGVAVDRFSGLEEYQGSEFADNLIGSAGGDHLDGLSGRDVVLGEDGDDTLTASSGQIDAGRGDDTYLGRHEGTRGLTVRLGPGADRAVLDAARHTTVLGGPGDDVVEVPPPEFGTDVRRTVASLLGGAGHDRLTFADNPVRVRIDVEARTAVWTGGRLGFDGFDGFVGSRGRDVLVGSAGSDRLFGAGGDDVLEGRGGQDVLAGGRGFDKAYGGRGRDTCFAERRFSC